MSVNVNNNVSSVDTKRFSKPSAASSTPASKASKEYRGAEDPDASEATVSTAAKRLQGSTSSGASNKVGAEAGSVPDSPDSQDTGHWLDLAASMKQQILRQNTQF